MKHKHHDLIVTWAADTSKVVQIKTERGLWVDAEATPAWNPHIEYRLKPEPVPDVTVECVALKVYPRLISVWAATNSVAPAANLRLTFDGETGKLKSAEVLK